MLEVIPNARLEGVHDGGSAYHFAYRDSERTPYAMTREDGAMDGPNHYDTFTSRWTAPDPRGDAGGDPAVPYRKSSNDRAITPIPAIRP